MSQKSSSIPTILIYIKCTGGGASGKKQALDLQVGSTVKDLKQHARCLYPKTTVNRIIFGGKILKEDDKSLSDYGVYKECTVQLMLRKADAKDFMDKSQIKQFQQRRMKRSHTEDDIQFGDAIIIRLIQARNLMEFDITNPYSVLQYDGQVCFFLFFCML